MKCISFNINSVRARPHQLIHLRDNLDPDVIGLQETKVDDPEFPMEEINEIGYHAEHWGGKGHYGVALLSKEKPIFVQTAENSDIIIVNPCIFNQRLFFIIVAFILAYNCF